MQVKSRSEVTILVLFILDRYILICSSNLIEVEIMSADDRMAGGSVAFASRKRSRETPEENQCFLFVFFFSPADDGRRARPAQTPLIGLRLKDVVSRRPIE